MGKPSGAMGRVLAWVVVVGIGEVVVGIDAWWSQPSGESSGQVACSQNGICRKAAHWPVMVRDERAPLAKITVDTVQITGSQDGGTAFFETHLAPTARGDAQVFTVNWQSTGDARRVCGSATFSGSNGSRVELPKTACADFGAPLVDRPAESADAFLRFGNFTALGKRLLGHVAFSARLAGDSVATQKVAVTAEISVDGEMPFRPLPPDGIKSLAYFDRQGPTLYERFHLAHDEILSHPPKSVCYRARFEDARSSDGGSAHARMIITGDPAWPSGYAKDDRTRCWDFA